MKYSSVLTKYKFSYKKNIKQNDFHKNMFYYNHRFYYCYKNEVLSTDGAINLINDLLYQINQIAHVV